MNAAKARGGGMRGERKSVEWVERRRTATPSKTSELCHIRPASEKPLMMTTYEAPVALGFWAKKCSLI